MVFALARDGKIRYVNQALGGRTADEVVGSSMYDWMASEQHEGLRAALDDAFRLGQPGGIELTHLPRHEPQAWYECRITPTHRGGDVVSATLVARDITRYKLAIEEWNRRYAELAQRFEE